MTVGISALVGFIGLEAVAGFVATVGWFLLTPIFLFWGEEIAEWLYGEETERADVPSRDTEDDALAERKRRYASGDINEEEFERRHEGLLAAAELSDELFESGSGPGESDRERDSNGTVQSSETASRSTAGGSWVPKSGWVSSIQRKTRPPERNMATAVP